MEHLLCTWLSFYYSYFTNEAMKAQKVGHTEPGFEPKQSDSGDHLDYTSSFLKIFKRLFI